MSRLRSIYDTDIVDGMMKKFNYKNRLAVPKIEKVVVNIGLVRNVTRGMCTGLSEI